MHHLVFLKYIKLGIKIVVVAANNFLHVKLSFLLFPEKKSKQFSPNITLPTGSCVKTNVLTSTYKTY